MMYQEFQKLTCKNCSFEDFEKFEIMYMASDMSKQEFCEFIKPAVKSAPKKSSELVRKYSRHEFDSSDDPRYKIYEIVDVRVSDGKMLVRDTGRELKGVDCWAIRKVYDTDIVIIA